MGSSDSSGDTARCDFSNFVGAYERGDGSLRFSEETRMERVTVIDGGLSTQLALTVGDVIDGDPLWSSRYLAVNPGAVLKAHLEFLRAGAEIIITNSYQASVQGFATHLNMDQKSSYELIKESVKIAKRAVETYMRENPREARPKVAGSIGPYGACLNDGSEYTGNYVDEVGVDKIVEWHRPRIQAMMEEGVDFLAIETIPAVTEALGLISLMKEYPRQRFWLSFQCKDGTTIAHGEKFSEVVTRCWEISKGQMVAVGCNCVNPKFVSSLLRSVEDDKRKEIPFIVYPNSGEVYSPATGWSPENHGSDFTEEIHNWLDLGVRYIGGCCRTDSRHIKKIRDEVSKWSRYN